MNGKPRIEGDLWTSFADDEPLQKVTGPGDGSEWKGAFDRRKKLRTEDQENPASPQSDNPPE